MIYKASVIVLLAIISSLHAVPAEADQDQNQGRNLYIKHCSECHHPNRLGQTAPPLIPQMFSRSVKGKIAKVISDGLPASRMPAYKNKLSKDQISQITEYIKSPIEPGQLLWADKDILQSRSVKKMKPRHKDAEAITDLEAVTLVMERGTKSLALLNGPQLDKITKFEVGDVHGGPKFSYSLENVYSVSRDGLVTWFNIPSLATVGKLKAGINSRSVAVSHDDSIVAVANYLPANIVFFDSADLAPIKTISLPGKVGGFYSLPELKAFVVSFRELSELWIIFPENGYKIKKATLPEPFEDFSISPEKPYLLGTKRGTDNLYIYDYKMEKIVAKLPTSGLPHLASAAFYKDGGRLYATINHIKKPYATILSLDELKEVAKIPLPGAGFFVRTHYATPYLWIDTESEQVVLVDKSDFSKVRYITPMAGRKAMHVEFTKNGLYALVTIPGVDGAVVVYDTSTIKKIKTMPYQRPVGKYNGRNKTYPGRSLERPAYHTSKSDGETVFNDYCMGCHHQTYEAFGPSFTDIAQVRTETEIRNHIKSPGKSSESLGYEQNSMSHIKLSKPQLDAIVSYIISFREVD